VIPPYLLAAGLEETRKRTADADAVERLAPSSHTRRGSLARALGLTPLHPPLPLAHGLRRVRRVVVEVAVLVMWHTRQALPLRRARALALGREEHL
jgi:hypothetical protein